MPSAVRLREDYSAEELRGLARRSKDVNQSRRLLIVGRRSRRNGPRGGREGLDRQTLRDWVHRFNALGPDFLFDNWTEGPMPRLSAEQVAEFAQIVEAGPDRETDASCVGGGSILSASSPSGSASTSTSAMSDRFRRRSAFSTSAQDRAIPRDRRGVQKNFPRAPKAHLDGLPETTSVEIWFQMLCGSGLENGQTSVSPHDRWYKS